MLEATHKLVLAFITLMVGLVLIGTIATQANNVTTPISVSSETVNIAPARLAGGAINTSKVFTVTNAATGWKSTDAPNECLPAYEAAGYGAPFIYYNQSGDYMTKNTDYIVTSTTGSFTLKNVKNLNSSTSNTTTVSYSYCGDDYLNSGWGQTVILLVGGFFAIALLLISVGLFFSVAKDYGLY